MKPVSLLLWVVVCCGVARAANPADGQKAPPKSLTPLQTARKLLQHGQYAEAEELFTAAVDTSPEAPLGLAQCQTSQGHRNQALKTLVAAQARFPKSPAVLSQLADMHFAAGDYKQAQAAVDGALKLDPQHIAARWRLAELRRVTGQTDEAKKVYRSLVDFYNQHDVVDPAALRLLGLAAAQHARWNGLSDDFQQIISDLYPALLQRDSDNWQAHFESGRLLLEKYNEAGATQELLAAQRINPQVAEVYAARAEMALQSYDLPAARASLARALELNPELTWAYQLRADLHLINGDLAAAATDLEMARKLNPVDEATLGRLAVIYTEQQDSSRDLSNIDLSQSDFRQTPAGKLIEEVVARNPHAGEFYAAMAESLDHLRKYPAAARFYREAIAKLPELISARSELGLVEMRLGEETAAAKTLDEAFRRDPFHVRVSNMRKVLDVLDHYALLETEHFVIKFDRAHDQVLAKLVGNYLEDEVYPQITKRLNFAPRTKTLFEIFNRSGKTDGHGWFSARMVGLPSIGTVGACAGKMVALTSPGSMAHPFNWARVVRHEFVHVVNLQQTNFNIPHWYTEGLAVDLEGQAPPANWDTLLAQRLAKKQLFNLDDINFAFSRPKSADDWQMAYCQGWLYVRYLAEKYGPDANAKLLEQYALSGNTQRALQQAVGVNRTDFERGYRQFLEDRVARQKLASPADDADDDPAELKTKLAADPDNPDLLARQALVSLQKSQWAAARSAADRALEKQPRQQLAAYVLARLLMQAGDVTRAVATLEGALDRQSPNGRLLALLAGLKLKADDYAAAADLYQLGQQAQPGRIQWTQSLARVYLKSQQDDKLVEPLARLAEHDYDDAVSRKKLAQLALAAKDYAAAGRWSKELLQIEAADADAHRLSAEAAVERGDLSAAVSSYELAILLEPEASALRLALARLLVQQKQPNRARQQLQQLLKMDANNAEAKQMLESIQP